MANDHVGAAGYLRRVADDELTEALSRAGAVSIEGPKAVGKTSTAREYASTVVALDDPDDQVAAMVDVDPASLLTGKPPVLIDEWQTFPDMWNRVRREVDNRRNAPGQFILTGSSTPEDSVRRHSGAGRFAIIQMRPMSLYESGSSTGEVSLRALFSGAVPHAFDPTWNATEARLEAAKLIVTGGWPANIARDVDAAARNNIDYLTVIREYDLARIAGLAREPAAAAKVIRSLARNIATPAAETTISKALVYGEDESGVPEDITSRPTTRAHLAALERLRIVEDQPAWAPSLRSARRVTVAPKRHFIDPCLAAAALGISWQPLADDVKTLGLWFESLAVRDLRVYSQPLGGRVLHYRDVKKLEVDAIIELPDGRWGACEIKLGSTKRTLDAAATSLLALQDQVGSQRMAFMCVITNGAVATRRPDGVDVVPLRMLAP